MVDIDLEILCEVKDTTWHLSDMLCKILAILSGPIISQMGKKWAKIKEKWPFFKRRYMANK